MSIDPRRLALLRQQYGHLKNAADLERDYLQEVLDLLQTRVSNELNRFVRKITAYGTIAISWTVVAGIYGMNFSNMPELTWTYGYPAAIGLMLILSVRPLVPLPPPPLAMTRKGRGREAPPLALRC